MKKRMKKTISFLLAFAMVITLLPVSVQPVKAETVTKVIPGAVNKATDGTMTFPNLKVEGGNQIKSISIQFSSAVQDQDQILFQTPTEYTALLSKMTNPQNTSGYDKHIIVNAASNDTTVTDAQWQDALRRGLSIRLSDNDIRKVSFIVETEVTTKFVEFNYFNGHYYEVVNKNDVRWTEAYAESEGKTYHGMDGYLVTITSKEENDFVVSICQADTWIGSTCSDEYKYTYGRGDRDKAAGVASFYFTGGDEKGQLMCTVKRGQGTNPVEVGSVMQQGYTNWDPKGEPNFQDSGSGEELYVNLYLTSLWGGTPKTWNDLYDTGATEIDSYVVEYGNVLHNGNTMEEKSEIVLNSSYNLNANDFIITTDEAKNITNSQIINYGNATATQLDTEDKEIDVTNQIQVTENNITSVSGIYGVQYTVGGEVTKSVVAKVVDKKSENTASSDIAIYANGITLTTQDVTKGPDYKALSSVMAKVLSTGAAIPNENITITSNTTVATPGNYTVTYTASFGGKTESVTVLVKVVAADKVSIEAQDFCISKDVILTQDMAKTLSGVTATLGTDAIHTSDISADISQATRNPGDVYDVKFTTSGESTTVKVTVMDNATSNDVAKINIGANDFTISLDEYDTADLATKAGVIAKNYDGSVRSDITIDSHLAKKEAGTYPITFTTGTGSQATSVTVSMTVTGSSLSAKDIVIGAGDKLTAEDAKKLGDVTGTDKDGSATDLSTVTVDKNQLDLINQASEDGNKGIFDLTFTNKDNVSEVIHVTIKDKKEDNQVTDEKVSDKISIAANDFTIGTEDYSKLTKDNVIKLSNAVATNETKHTPVTITGVDTSKVLNKPGTYPVTLSTADGTTVTVNCTIDEDYKTVGDIDQAADKNEDMGQSTTDNSTAVKNDGTNATPGPGGTTPGTLTPGPTSQLPDTVGPDKVFEKTNPVDIKEPIDTGRTVQEVTIDGVTIPSSAYTTKDGNVVINKSYLGTLPVGKHPVIMKYTDGSKKTFSIQVVEFDNTTVVKKVPIFNMNKTISVKSKFTLNLVGINSTAMVSFKSSNKKIATVNSKGVIVGKKKGKCTVSGCVIQKGAYYKVNVKIKVVKKLKIYNLTKKALSKKSGELPEFNVYKRVFKGKKTKLKFTSVQKDAKISYKSSKKKIATVSKKGVIKGKKKGFCVVTATIVQNGKTFVTRVFVRVDDYTKNKQLKKYLK